MTLNLPNMSCGGDLKNSATKTNMTLQILLTIQSNPVHTEQLTAIRSHPLNVPIVTLTPETLTRLGV